MQADTDDGTAGCGHAGVDLTQARTRTTVSVCSAGVGIAERKKKGQKAGFRVPEARHVGGRGHY